MPRHRLEMIVHMPSAPDELWNRITDVGTWDEWGPWDESCVERGGRSDGSAVGTVWTLRHAGGRPARFEVLECDQQHFAFDLWSGLPFSSLALDVSVLPVASGGAQVRVAVVADVDFADATKVTRDAIEHSVHAALQQLTRDVEVAVAAAAHSRDPHDGSARISA